MGSLSLSSPEKGLGKRGIGRPARRSGKGLEPVAALQLPRLEVRGGLESQARLRAYARSLTRFATQRDLAARMGVSHGLFSNFLRGGTIRKATAARILRFATGPTEGDVVQTLRQSLQRLLGPLGTRRARQVEGQTGKAIRRAYYEAGLKAPAWASELGRKQV